MYAFVCMGMLSSELPAILSYGHPLTPRCPDEGGLSVFDCLSSSSIRYWYVGHKKRYVSNDEHFTKNMLHWCCTGIAALGKL